MSLAVDATGFAVRSSKLVWLSSGVRFKERRAFVKAHLAVETTWLSVQAYVLTSSRVHETTQLERLLEDVHGLGDVYADSGYLSVGNAWLVASKGGTPYMEPKVTTTGSGRRSARGVYPGPYRSMVDAYRRDPPGWMKRYHQRSKIEGVNGAIKRRLGRTLWSASDLFRRLELALKFVVWNLIRLVYKRTAEGLE
jgi:IS5 family transposase